MYILETLKCIDTVKTFCVSRAKWTSERETELDKMAVIKAKAENKNKTWGQYIWSSMTKDSSWLEKELGEVLKNTLEGLEKLQHFLNAVEMLAVTSLPIFTDESFMPKGGSSMSVRSVIFDAISVSPLLIHFKRDDGEFFLPSFSNMEVLTFQLE